MIFELRNKIPQNSSFIYSEDVLTGTIFGNLRYFKNQHLLIHFLNEAVDLQGSKLLLNKDFLYEILFWKKYRSSYDNDSYNEPDLVLHNKNDAIIIECKYFSSLSEDTIEVDGKEEYRNQLIRYASVINDYYFNKEHKAIVFLTNEKTMPKDILKETKIHLDKKYKNIKLYWLSWNSLYTVIQNNYSDISADNKILLSDLTEFLIKRKLYNFDGFNVKKIKYDRFYKKDYFIISKHLFEWRYIPKIKYYFNIIHPVDKINFYKYYYFSHIKKDNINWRYKK
ncbi:MAG: hypothetical protein FWD26_03895 [Treponema sp.]|nr:hypothetical protein [Treponema sp.]